MGCGASAARTVESPRSPSNLPDVTSGKLGLLEQKMAKEKTELADLSSASQQQRSDSSTRLPKEPEDDGLEGLLASLEEKEASGSPSSTAKLLGKVVEKVKESGEMQTGQSGDLEQLLSELEAPAPASPSQDKTSSSVAQPASPKSLLPLKSDLPGKPQEGTTRQLAPLKISGRVPMGSSLVPVTAPAPLAFPPVRNLSPTQKSSGAVGNSRGDDWWELEQPDSASLLTIDHLKLMGPGSRTSSLGSPSTAKTTYITFDIVADEHLSELLGGGQGRLLGEGSEERGLGGANSVGGSFGRSVAVLEQKAAEVDELLRDVFEDDTVGGRAGGFSAGKEGATLGTGAGGREKRSSGGGAKSERYSDDERSVQSGSVDDLWRSIQAGTRGREERGSPPTGRTAGPESIKQSRDRSSSGKKDASTGATSANMASGDGRSDRSWTVDGAVPGRETGDRGGQRNGGMGGGPRESGRFATPGSGRSVDGADVLDVDDLEDIARDEETAGRGQEAEARPSHQHGSSTAGSALRLIDQEWHSPEEPANVARSRRGVEGGIDRMDSWQGSRRQSSTSDRMSLQQSGRFDAVEPMEDLLVLDTADLEDEL
jgi:hypothetical protein